MDCGGLAILKFYIKCQLCGVMHLGRWASVTLPRLLPIFLYLGEGENSFSCIQEQDRSGKVSQTILTDLKSQSGTGEHISVFWAPWKGHGRDWVQAKFVGSWIRDHWWTCQQPEGSVTLNQISNVYLKECWCRQMTAHIFSPLPFTLMPWHSYLSP